MNTDTLTTPTALSHFDFQSESPADITAQLAGNYRLALVYINPPKDDDAPYTELPLHPAAWNRLLAQLQAGRPAFPPLVPEERMRFGDVSVDFQRYEAHRSGERVALTSLEFKVLKFFLQNPQRVVSRQELLERVWGFHCYPNTRTVDNQILHLRRKLENEPAIPTHFKTVHGIGYRFVP